MAQSKAAKYLKVSESFVQMWVARYRDVGNVDDIPKSGRPPATTDIRSTYGQDGGGWKPQDYTADSQWAG